MGFGDAIMAAGQAQVLYDRLCSLDHHTPPVMICEQSGAPRWHYLWENNPVIVCPKPGAARREPSILTGKGCLPYIQYPFSEASGWRFSSTWRARDHRARYYLHDHEYDYAASIYADYGPYVVVEPPALNRNVNRRGPIEFWYALVAQVRPHLPLRLVQLAHDQAQLLPDVPPIAHSSFRQVAAILSGASLLITVEGGLAHMAATLATPTVVLWGGCIDPNVLGYPEQANLVDPRHSGCGSFKPCDHCAAVWGRYSVDGVLAAARQLVSL